MRQGFFRQTGSIERDKDLIHLDRRQSIGSMGRADEQQRIGRRLNDFARYAAEEPSSRSGNTVCRHGDQA